MSCSDSVKVKPPAKVIDTGGGFLLEEEEEASSSQNTQKIVQELGKVI